MFFASEKEYEFLKKEVSEIRDCITKHIGYIISVAGISGVLNKYISSEELPAIYALLLIAITMGIITLIFDVVWYKFKSHNRFVGYIQLLLQEVSHHNIRNLSPEERAAKLYLDTLPPEIEKEQLKKENIYSWEFIMSRYNNAMFHDSESKLLNSTDRSIFGFKLPRTYKYSMLEKGFKDLDNQFFKKIIYPLYGFTKKEFNPLIFILGILKIPFKMVWLAVITFLPQKAYIVSKRSLDFDTKYITSGWLYPKKITQIAFVPIFVLFGILTYLTFWDPYNSISTINSGPQLFQMLTIYILAALIFIYWFWAYLNNLPEILYGTDSIDYYCWTFFIYRVQQLNSLGIMPVFFSRSFIRFFKSKIILYELEARESFFLGDKEPCFCMMKKDAQTNTSPKPCKSCLNKYSTRLEKCQKLPANLSAVHEYVLQKIKETMEKRG